MSLSLLGMLYQIVFSSIPLFDGENKITFYTYKIDLKVQLPTDLFNSFASLLFSVTMRTSNKALVIFN